MSINLQLTLARSPTGRHLLLNGFVGLTPPERQLLNTVNGSRTRKDLLSIIGQDADDLVNQMITQGLLLEYPVLPCLLIPDPSSVQWAHTQDELPRDLPSAQLAMRLEILARQEGVSASVTTKISTVVKVSKLRGKRSLVATKMYTIDMLKLMLSPTSSAYISAIQSSTDPTEMMQYVLSAMQYFQARSAPSYAAKVMCHLHEVIPVEYLEQLDLMIFDVLMSEEQHDSYSGVETHEHA